MDKQEMLDELMATSNKELADYLSAIIYHHNKEAYLYEAVRRILLSLPEGAVEDG